MTVSNKIKSNAKPKEGDHCNWWRKEWKEGYERGYSNAMRNWTLKDKKE